MIEISEYIELRGVKQYILITGNENNPLMLFLHGGPGFSHSGFIRKYQSKLEKDFLIVNWDQRGAGKSNNKNFSRSELTIDNIVEDAICLIDILLNKFKKNKLYLVGHSFGSLLAVILAKKAPRYISSVISIGQVVNINEGDKISYNFLNKIMKLDNDIKGLNILREIGMPPYKNKYNIKKLNKLISKYNGNIFKLSEITFILKSISFKYYNLFDWIKFIKGIIISNRYMYSEMSCINLFNEIDSIDVPIYFCVGDNDYSTPVKLVKEYYNFIHAPKKELYRFKSSSHMPNIEEETTFYNLCKTICANND